ncbi:MAG: hypothetical protein MMC23_008918 [Stictis urceolatum]|nr:hypothetical protein [Stictis urceolata]
MTSDESQPLLNSDHIAGEAPRYERFSWLLNGVNGTYVHTSRTKAQRFLTSKAGHYAVILLVSADVLCIIADFVINLFICERQCGQLSGDLRGLVTAHDALGIVSLIFSSLFMAELIASTWAFGINYFHSRFHCLDAAVIIAAFVLDVFLQGAIEEIGSAVVILRLWRVFKIIEELSTGAQEQMDTLNERIEQLEKENQRLQREAEAL